MASDILINPSVLKKCIGGSEQTFIEAIENAANVNTRLCIERKMRLPFLDSQTGVAQNHTALWHPYKDRQQGQCKGQLYSYPVKRWKKKKRLAFMNAECKKTSEIETGEADMHQISTVENPAIRVEDEKNELSKDAWYDEYDDIDEPPDAGEMVDDQSDISDFEETYIKRRKKKGPGRGRKKNIDKDKDLNPEEREKPYACEVCNARYKTRPGLSYHYNHFHNGIIDDQELSQSPKPQRSTRNSSGPKSNMSIDDKISANNYCDFCLGDSTENKKTEMPEDLVSCSDCGRSGHPTCLQFTQNMIVSVKKYPWQCIECKSCGLCGTSDNDDQLLFCDDCDRGYHMYCLNPPLTTPPEGNWSCHLCIEEFHGGKKPEGMN
ncbi:zinc finger protein ubi-d4 B-like isoform X2 [Mytilus edulis]|uniref:Histone acetyltransferase KAT6A,Zinc finger protein ubi-d4 A,Zinc finger protein ubi-d4 B,Zinc finger protein DPF3,Zinc finger protein ubi-d4,Zinc finger protein neuro-d4 n=1 Tax=Mytilus edulis TaxID=6550 RepID=A0A8S3UX33_MYTED|nr:Histone acetyltransferase KAT6A,Zinc finger protein ubi-d4 A,Zinc finger protein ubi-d4 B,Zinc finger protein DPF3,Zinc finger protein ubi-d4,Zinc finger protein neuro-d4 [Mytilus edulis]